MLVRAGLNERPCPRTLSTQIVRSVSFRASEAVLGRERVVGRAGQRDFFELVGTALRQRHEAMDLNEVRFGAALALLIHERASSVVALAHLAAQGAGTYLPRWRWWLAALGHEIFHKETR